MAPQRIWELGEAGPSDYASRAWAGDKGIGRGKVEDWTEDWAGTTEPTSAHRARPRSTRPRRSSTSSAVSSSADEGDDPGEMEDEEEGIGDHRKYPSSSSYRRLNKRSKPIRSTSLLPLALLPLLPTTRAAPPIYTRPSPSPSPSSAVTPTASSPRITPSLSPLQIQRDKRAVQYQTSAAPPSAFPTELATVDETLLPYIVTRGPDGLYTKVNDGWRLYGRQSGESPVFAPNEPESTQTSSWAIDQALPPGWGVQSSRTDFYRVPLIVVASCLIAVGIVVAIIIIALKRKKAHRRAKRRAERQRRKALAAAGLTEEDVNDSRNQANMREKLDDLQRQHRAKRKGETGVVSSPSARSRVRSWRAGLLRRRKGKGDGGDDEGPGEVGLVIEPKPENGDGVQGPERDSEETDRSTPTVPSDEPGTGSFESEGGIGSRLNTVSSEETDSTTQNGTTPDHTDTSASSNPGLVVPGATTTTPYFPPAYRPASVRSFGRPSPSDRPPANPSASSSSRPPHPSPVLPTAEKVHAPRYYPAPATAEGEVALAVASRSEGKGRMPLPSPELEPDEVREVTGHAATDDKLVMERMRMAASAPPAPPPEDEGDAGPSAPTVEVDTDGFERLVHDQPEPESGPSSSVPPTALGAPIGHHPALPAPPSRPLFGRSYSIEREVHEQLDELNLLPSAPPLPRAPLLRQGEAVSSTPDLGGEEAVPSAPPMLDEGDDEDVEESGPSAPPLTMVEDEKQGTVEVSSGGAEVGSRADADEQGREGVVGGEEADEEAQRRPSEAPSEPRLFLPKYEP